jgi:hypothetical protein
MPKVKPRLPTEAVYFRETDDDTTFAAAVERHDRIIDELGWLKGREVEKPTYAGFDGLYSWSEHSARRMASTAPDVQRPHLAAFLRKRGFLKD